MDPFTIAIIIISIASAYQTKRSADQAAEDNKNYLEKQSKINAEIAEDEADQSASEVTKEAIKQRAQIRATTGEMGLGGQTTDQFIEDSLFEEQEEIERIEFARVKKLEAAKIRAEGGAISGGSTIAAGLQIAGAVASAGARSANKKTDGKV